MLSGGARVTRCTSWCAMAACTFGSKGVPDPYAPMACGIVVKSCFSGF